MKIEHLYYFIIVANTKSINKAAQKLFISQQHLSRVVYNLENDLQVQLLQRNSTGVKLTDKGKAFYQYAEKIVNIYREMQSSFFLDTLPLQDENKQLSGRCQIVLPFFFSLFLTDFIQRFNETHPAIDLCCFEGNAQHTAEEIHQSENLYLIIDTAAQIDRLLQAESELKSYYIGDTSVSFCVNRASSLANKTLLTKSDIVSFKQTGYTQNIWNDKLSENQLLFISSNIYRHLDSVIQNNSVCIVPSYTRAGIYAAYPEILLLPFEKSPLIAIYIFHSSNHILSDAEIATIRFVAEYMRKIEQMDKLESLGYFPHDVKTV